MKNISIIIPTLNEVENIRRLLIFFEVLRTEPLLEVIIADSPDSKDDVELFANRDFVKYLRTRGCGRATQMNEAVAIAKGEVLIFLHADVTPPNTFERDIADVLNAGYYFGFFSYRFEPSSFMLNINASFTQKDGIFAGGGDQIHFMTRHFFELMGGYDTSYHIMEDFDFVRRCRKMGISPKIINNPAIVSSRKYKNSSWLKVNLLNLIAFIMFKLKVPNHKIRNIYYSMLSIK